MTTKRPSATDRRRPASPRLAIGLGVVCLALTLPGLAAAAAPGKGQGGGQPQGGGQGGGPPAGVGQGGGQGGGQPQGGGQGGGPPQGGGQGGGPAPVSGQPQGAAQAPSGGQTGGGAAPAGGGGGAPSARSAPAGSGPGGAQPSAGGAQMVPGDPNSPGAGLQSTPGGSPAAGAVEGGPAGGQLPSDPQAITRALLLGGPSVTGAVEAVRAVLDALKVVIEALRAQMAPTVPATALTAADAAWASLMAILADLGAPRPELVLEPRPGSEAADLAAVDRPPVRGETVAGALGIAQLSGTGGVTARAPRPGASGQVRAAIPGLSSSPTNEQEGPGLALVANSGPAGRTAQEAELAEARGLPSPGQSRGLPGARTAPANLMWVQTVGLFLAGLVLFGTARVLRARRDRRMVYWSY